MLVNAHVVLVCPGWGLICIINNKHLYIYTLCITPCFLLCDVLTKPMDILCLGPPNPLPVASSIAATTFRQVSCVNLAADLRNPIFPKCDMLKMITVLRNTNLAEFGNNKMKNNYLLLSFLFLCWTESCFWKTEESNEKCSKNKNIEKSGKPLWSSVMGHTRFDLNYSNMMVMSSLGQWNKRTTAISAISHLPSAKVVKL